MLLLLAIPVVIPIVIMQVTGTSGAAKNQLANNIVAPPTIVAVEAEETSDAERAEAFLKVKNTTVGVVLREAAGWRRWW
jgi:hypothetical protein